MDSLKFLLAREKKTRQTNTIEQALSESSCIAIEKISGFLNLDKKVALIQPDILIMELGHPTPSTLDSIRIINTEYPIPIIIFAEEQAHSSNIDSVIDAGVSAYVVDGLQASRIRTIVEIAIARFQQNLHLRTELELTKNQLLNRKVIAKAKGILMSSKGISEQDAYRTLQKLSMDRNIPLSEMAKNILCMAEILTLN